MRFINTLRTSTVRASLMVVIACAATAEAGSAQTRTRAQATAADRAAVRAAVQDYVDALYKVDPKLIERSVHPSLAKLGFVQNATTDAYAEARMTYAQLLSLAARWNKDGHVKSTAPKEIVVYDVMDQTATAKLTAEWGVDYLQLGKFDGRWKIVNIVWQTNRAAR